MELYCRPSNNSGADLALQHEDAESDLGRLHASPPPGVIPIVPKPIALAELAVVDPGLASTPAIERSGSSFGSCK